MQRKIFKFVVPSPSSTPDEETTSTKKGKRNIHITFTHLKILVVTSLLTYMFTDFAVPLILMSDKFSVFYNTVFYQDMNITGSSIVWIVASIIFLLISFIIVLLCFNSMLELFLGGITPIIFRLWTIYVENKHPIYWDEEPTLTILLIYFIIMIMLCMIMEIVTKKWSLHEFLHDVGIISTFLLLYAFAMYFWFSHSISSDFSMQLIKIMPILTMSMAGKVNIEDFVPKLSVKPASESPKEETNTEENE